jgi:SAM-dependent methyltransferase
VTDTSTDLQVLLDGLSGERAVIRSGAYHALLASLWHEDEARLGLGVARAAALPAVPALIAPLQRLDPLGRQRVVFLLGLLAATGASDEGDAALAALHAAIRTGVPVYLDLLDSVRHDTAGSEADALTSALTYLLAHFDEDRERITARVAAACGADSSELRALSAVFELDQERPARSRAIRMYLGAESCAAAGGNRLDLCERSLACPVCRAPLSFEARDIPCTACGARYKYRGDILDLVPAGSSDPNQFSEDLVAIYEAQTRARFVRVMASDWEHNVMPPREERYLERHLQPVAGPVLDLACGAGGWTALVARQAGTDRVLALDYSMPMLEACQRVLPTVLCVRGSASKLPVVDGVLGGANCSDALQALPDPAAAIAEVARCLRPGAPFTAFTFRRAQPPYQYFQHGFPTHQRRSFTESEIGGFIERAGLDLVDIGGPGHALFFAARKPRTGPAF